jgi:hypothetical protein
LARQEGRWEALAPPSDALRSSVSYQHFSKV